MRWSKTQEPVFMHLAGNTRTRQRDYWKQWTEQFLESYHINSGGGQTLINRGLVVRNALVYGDGLGVMAVQCSVYAQRLAFSLLVWFWFFMKTCKSQRREPDFLSVVGGLQDCSTQHRAYARTYAFRTMYRCPTDLLLSRGTQQEVKNSSKPQSLHGTATPNPRNVHRDCICLHIQIHALQPCLPHRHIWKYLSCFSSLRYAVKTHYIFSFLSRKDPPWLKNLIK